ncbi:MAG: hypothetical protein AAFX44_16455 [Pseudomonadota bacterium]
MARRPDPFDNDPGGAAGGGGGGDLGGLDDEFDKTLDDFEDGLNRDQQQASEQGRDLGTFERGEPGGNSGGRRSGGVSVGNRADPNAAPPSSGGQTSGQQGGTGGRQSDSSSESQPSVQGVSDDQIAERTPEDIPEPFDDDIVAQQLREVALAEEDPELREKYWEEYRKYKGIN